MATRLDNLDDVMRTFAKLEKAAELEAIREARKRMRAVMRSLTPLVKRSTPKDTGVAAKSVRVKSRSRRGVSSARIQWDAFYAGFLNFKKNQSGEKFATDLWNQEKDRLEKEGEELATESMKVVLERHGIKVKTT